MERVRTFRNGASRWGALLCLVILVLGFRVPMAGAGDRQKDSTVPPDQIDRIMALLPVTPDFVSAKALFLHYGLTVKSAMVSRVSDQDSITIRIDFFLPVPAQCHPSEEERRQYYLEEAVWEKNLQSDSFDPVNQWARHLSLDQSDWLAHTACYP